MENLSNIALLLLIGNMFGTLVMGYPKPRPNEDGSRCPNTFCSPPLPGAQCTPSYERDDGCCPVWYCNLNGEFSQIYGQSTGGSYSSSSWSSSSSGDGGMPNFGGSGGMSNFGGGGGMSNFGGGGGMSNFGGSGMSNFGGGSFSSFNSGGFPNSGMGGRPSFGGLGLQLPNLGNLLGRR